MIRINLAKSSAFPSDGEAPSGGGISLPSFGSLTGDAGEKPLAKVALVLIFPLAIYIWEQRGLSSYKVRLAQLNTELTQTTNDIGQFGAAGEAVADIKVERDKLQKKLEVIAKISSKRAFKIQTLAALQDLIPEDCWLKEVSINNSEISFDGFARSPTSVQAFVERLGSLKFLTSVTNQGVTRTQLGETSVHEFRVVAQVSNF